jgi:dTDP-4-amino-4,6-dideoxygalactose transaminase
MRIPFLFLDRQYTEIKKPVDAAIARVVKRGVFILGREVSAFEKEFAAYIGSTYAIGVGSGTDALTLSLSAVGVDAESEVIVPTNSYPTVFGVAKSGAAIKLVDCDQSGLLDISTLPQAITAKTRAIVAVHLYGNPVDIWAIAGVLKKLNRTDIQIIEDCAQAHGATLPATSYQLSAISSKAGSVGVVGCFSFYPTKNLGAYGDGGMITTSDAKLAERIRMLRMYGERVRYQSEEIAGVSRLDELQAAILRVKLKKLDQWNQRRKTIAKRYYAELSPISGIGLLPQRSESVFHLFVMTTNRRTSWMNALSKAGINTAIHYPGAIHEQPAFLSLGYKPGAFPVAEQLSRTVVSLPIDPWLTEREVSYIVKTIRTCQI